MKAIWMNTTMAAVLLMAAALGTGCGGDNIDARIAEQQRLQVAAVNQQQEQMRLATMRVQALDVELQALDQTLTQLERTHAAQVNQVRLQSQKLAAELAALKLSMGVSTPAVAAAPEVPDEPGQITPVAVAPVGAPATAASSRVAVQDADRPYGFMAKLFFLVILVLAVGLIFHVVMSRVQEEEDDEGEDRIFRTEEGTISLSPRTQREMGEGEAERKDPYT